MLGLLEKFVTFLISMSFGLCHKLLFIYKQDQAKPYALIGAC